MNLIPLLTEPSPDDAWMRQELIGGQDVLWVGEDAIDVLVTCSSPNKRRDTYEMPKV